MANVSKLKYGDNTYDIKDASARHEAIDSTVSSDTSKLISSGAVKTYVDNSIAALPEPMIFKGTVGTGGTITSLPAAAASNEGFTYKVISNLSTPVIAKIGDTVISNGSVWTVIPSGDEPGGTVTNIATGTGLTGGPITSTGTISHADTSSQSSVSNSGRTYIQSVTLDGMGHVTGLTSATETVTNTDANVAQTATNTNANYEVLFSGTADNTTRTEGARKYSNLTFNPSTGNLNTTQINGVTVGSSPKFTDTDTKVTAVGNHYTPTGTTSKDASGGTITDIANSSSGTQVVTGVNIDAAGHVTGVKSVALKATNSTYTVNNGTLTIQKNGTNVQTFSANQSGNATANIIVPTKTSDLTNDSGFAGDTKNTAGSTDTSSKIFLIGATSQAANPQTYSDNEVYATNGVLTTKSVQVGGTAATIQYNSTNQCVEFVFA